MTGVGEEEITVPWRLMYLVKQSVFKPKWKRARNSSELHDKTLEMLFMTQFATVVCRCLILWVRLGTFFFFLSFKLYCMTLVVSSFLISVTVSMERAQCVLQTNWNIAPPCCFKTVTDGKELLHSGSSEISKVLIRKWPFYTVHPTITSEGWTCNDFIEKVPKSTRWADQQNANSKLQWGSDSKWPILAHFILRI